MSGGHPHPSRPGESIPGSARVRHRWSGRDGSVAEGGAGDPEQVLVLFDGAAAPRPVHARNLTFLDAAEPAPSPGDRP